MNIRAIPGAAYCDALPSGEYCALVIGSHIETHLGRIPLPPRESYGPLYLRCSNVGGFKFAGQAHDTGNPAAWEYRDGEWRAYGPPCCGVSPVIYDALGILHISDCSIGSQGWRYVDRDGTPEGRLVTGDASYGPVFGLSEYSRYAGFTIGQGHDSGGVLVWDGLFLHVLSPENGRFVRVQGSSDQVAIAFWAPNGAVIVHATLAELRALPLAGRSTPAPTPPPVPLPPVPPPTPEPASMPEIPSSEITRAVSMLATVRAETGFGPNKDDLPYVRLVAQRLGGRWGLNGKRGDPNNLSHDILAYRVDGNQPLLVDVLIDGGGANGPAFSVLPYPEPAGAVWIDPGPPPSGQPAPVPVQPAPFDPAPLLARLALAEARIAALEAAGADALDQIHQLDGTTVKVGQLADQLAGYAKKGDRVEVSGRISPFGVNRWGGTIL